MIEKNDIDFDFAKVYNLLLKDQDKYNHLDTEWLFSFLKLN